MLIIFKNNADSLNISDEISPTFGVTTYASVSSCFKKNIEAITSPTILTLNNAISVPVNIFLNSVWNADIQIVSIYSAQLNYIFTLTGTPDIEIPISSFQTRMRSGAQTYLSVVIPGIEYATEINTRTDGDIKIDATYYVGNIIVRQTIVWAHLRDISIDVGTKKQSITLSGYRQETYTPKAITLFGHTYFRLYDGKYTFRFSEPNIFLRPGDTITVDNTTFTADLITYYVSASANGAIETQIEVSGK